MKGKTKSALIMAMVLGLTGCADAAMQVDEQTVQETETEQVVESDVPETSEAAGTQEPAFGQDSFMWVYKQEETGIEIRLEDCDCLYESGQFRIWSKYLDYSSRKDVPFRYSGELLYLQTPEQSMQLYPDEYVIDYECGRIYVLYNEGDYFVSIYSYCAAASPAGEICGVGVLKSSLLEDWIAEAHGLPTYSSDKPWARSSNLRVNMTEVSHEQGATVLRGEVSGIYQATGETYCIEWELDTTSYEEKLMPVAPRIYDAEKDKAVFEACAAAYDRLEQGDWSLVAGREDKPNGDAWQGRRMDVNGDGLPDLIQEADANGLGISPILRIYTYVDGAEQPVREVFSDLNDFSEYYFVGADGKLIYDYSDHGEMAYGSYSQYQFDEKWNRKQVDGIEIYYFYDHYKEYEGEHERYSEYYPDTYGARGSGYYYFRCRRRTMEELKDIDTDNEEDIYWVREEISGQEFVRVYKEMTGWDFFTVMKGSF